MSTAAERLEHENLHVSLIDDLLELRDNPFPKTAAQLEEMLSDVKRIGPRWQAHLAAVDAALDILIPALQVIGSLQGAPTETESHRCNSTEIRQILKSHQLCLLRSDVMDVIGHIPRRRDGRYVRLSNG